MRMTDTLHRLRIDFTVTETIRRFVYVYLLVGARVHVIDTGVDGTETVVRDYLATLGRTPKDIATILLTHTHPDHIGAAAALKEMSGARLLGSAAERGWVEDIDTQFRDRPIPNFYRLINRSAALDGTLAEGDVLMLEDGMTLRVLEAHGHSHGSQAFYWQEARTLFTGDAIPVPGDIPIYVSAADSLETLMRLGTMSDVDVYLSAWDDPCDRIGVQEKIARARGMIEGIAVASKKAAAMHPHAALDEKISAVAGFLGLERLADNPLFRRSVLATFQEM